MAPASAPIRQNMRGAHRKIKLDTVTPRSLIITPITSPDVSTPKAFGAGTPLNAIVNPNMASFSQQDLRNLHATIFPKPDQNESESV